MAGLAVIRGSTAPCDVKFNLVDKVEHLSPERIVTVKYVSLAEEYLADHFPTFPVLPGVMMLESATQAAGWLLHHRTGFAKSMVVLKEARNVKYGTFVAPGNALRMEVDFQKISDTGASFKATGSVVNSAGQSSQAVQMRLELASFNLADKNPELAALDSRITEHNRRRWDLLAVVVNKGLE
jgi:3-hydroxyacyl-[acyl-carrier-protein] dehydratase